MPLMVNGIEHTAIASPDPSRLAQWYVDHLNFVVNYRSGSSKTLFVKAANGSMIEIIEAHNQPTAPHMRDAGLRHLAIEVTDLPAEYARLRKKGISFLTDPENANGGNTIAFFADCDGNILHLLHREKPLP